jgi:hypothetical protein
VEVGFTAGFQFNQEMSVTHAYETMAGQDSVVFFCIPYDEYTYEVMSDADPANIGKTLYIEWPQDAQIINMERETFNALPQNPMIIGSSVLQHRLGVPSSYMSRDAMVAACKQSGIEVMYDPTGVSSPVGSGQLATSSISYTDGKAITFGSHLSVSADVEAVTAGVLWGASLGVSVDTDFSLGCSDNTTVEGTVPSITTSDKPFKFGVGLIEKEDKAIQAAPFLIATYWVQ